MLCELEKLAVQAYGDSASRGVLNPRPLVSARLLAGACTSTTGRTNVVLLLWGLECIVFCQGRLCGLPSTCTPDLLLLVPSVQLRNVKRLGKQFTFGRQEDSHELFLRLVEAVEAVQLLEAGGKARHDLRSRETCLIHHVFGGYTRSQVRPTGCHLTTSGPALGLCWTSPHRHLGALLPLGFLATDVCMLWRRWSAGPAATSAAPTSAAPA